ncbi:MAG: DUF6263 family protein [Verrucomicrobiota bacterium]
MRKDVFLFILSLAVASFSCGCKKSEQADNGVASPRAEKSAPGKSGPAVELKVKWPVGNRYVYRIDIDQTVLTKMPQMPKPMQQAVTMAQTYALSVLTETNGGGRQLELEFLSQELEVKMGEQTLMSFDSKGDPSNDKQNPFAAPFRKMMGSRLTLILDSDGKVESVQGFDEWMEKVTGNSPPESKGMLSQIYNEDYVKQIADYTKWLPTKPVAVGDKWPSKVEVPAGPMGKLLLELNSTLKGWEEHDKRRCAVIESSGSLKTLPGQQTGPMGKMTIDKGKTTGRNWFDPELGTLVESASDQTMSMKIDMPGQPGGIQPAQSVSSDITQKVSIKLVELGTVTK